MKDPAMRFAYPLLHLALIAAMVVAAVAMASGRPLDLPALGQAAPLEAAAAVFDGG